MNKLAIATVIILFPGIIAAIICDKITVHNTKWGSFKYGMYSFVLGISCYVSLQLLAFTKDLMDAIVPTYSHLKWTQLEVWNIIKKDDVDIIFSEVLLATLLSVPIALLATYLINHKIFNKLATSCGVSRKYGDENLFSYYLTSDDIDWVYVRDIPNRLTYQGRINSYSENDNIQEIVLYDVTVYSYEESDELYSLPSIYLCKRMGKFIIESIPDERLEEYNEEETNN